MKRLDSFNCVVTMINDKLFMCKIASDGWPDMWAGALNWSEVKSPIEHDFIDAVNEVLGTQLTIEMFLKIQD